MTEPDREIRYISFIVTQGKSSTTTPPLPPPFSWPQVMLNTLTFRSDWRLISTNNITLESHIKVMRIKEMITTKEAPDC